MFNFKMLFWATMALSIGFVGCKKDEGDDDNLVLEPIVLDCNAFRNDTVLVDDPNRPVDYIVTCVMAVQGDVVIKEGVVIEFEDNTGINVSNSGSFKVEGTAADKVRFTGVNKIKGSWRGIIYFSQSVLNSVDHAEVSYAGGNSFNSNNDRGSIICYNCKVAITNTEMNNGKEHGFNNVYTSAEVVAFENNKITSHDGYPVYSICKYGYAYNSSNSFTGNGEDFIFLTGGQKLGGNHTWENLDVPYFVNGHIWIDDNQSLTVEAGTTVLFDDEGEIDVASGGYFAANGNANSMIYLGGIVEQPGSWLGIINSSSDQRNIITYTEIAYAGGGAHNSNGDLGTIVVWSSAYQEVTNSILRDNAANAPCAINAPYTNETLVLSGNTITNILNEECQ